MEYTIRINVATDAPRENFTTVSLGPGYSTVIRGVFSSGDGMIESFVEDNVLLALTLARLEAEVEQMEAEAAAAGSVAD